jgi:hypothetical protein
MKTTTTKHTATGAPQEGGSPLSCLTSLPADLLCVSRHTKGKTRPPPRPLRRVERSSAVFLTMSHKHVGCSASFKCGGWISAGYTYALSDHISVMGVSVSQGMTYDIHRWIVLYKRCSLVSIFDSQNFRNGLQSLPLRIR